MHRVVIASVFEFVTYSPAHLETAGWCHGYVATVKQAVDVTPKKEPVARFMFAVVGVWANMRRVQCWKRPLARNRAAPAVIVGNNDPKCALTKSRAN